MITKYKITEYILLADSGPHSIQWDHNFPCLGHCILLCSLMYPPYSQVPPPTTASVTNWKQFWSVAQGIFPHKLLSGKVSPYASKVPFSLECTNWYLALSNFIFLIFAHCSTIQVIWNPELEDSKSLAISQPCLLLTKMINFLCLLNVENIFLTKHSHRWDPTAFPRNLSPGQSQLLFNMLGKGLVTAACRQSSTCHLLLERNFYCTPSHTHSFM